LVGWIEWSLVTVFVGVPFVLLCYSAIATSLEISRKSQPFLDSFFDAFHIVFRYQRKGKTSGRSEPS